jgi:hypothetical protein
LPITPQKYSSLKTKNKRLHYAVTALALANKDLGSESFDPLLLLSPDTDKVHLHARQVHTQNSNIMGSDIDDYESI